MNERELLRVTSPREEYLMESDPGTPVTSLTAEISILDEDVYFSRPKMA